MIDKLLDQLEQKAAPVKSPQRKALSILWDRFFGEAKELFLKKNFDYNPCHDPLYGFRDWGVTGIVVRLGDKLSRWRNILKRDGFTALMTESVKDIITDIVVYCFLAYAYMEDEQTRCIREPEKNKYWEVGDDELKG